MHVCMHMHTCAYMYKHDNFMQMAEILGNPFMTSSLVRVCVHTCMCAHTWGTPKYSDRVPPILTPPQRGTPRISQNSKALELIEIFQFRLKI